MVVTCAVAAVALCELSRIERGRLFLLALPGEWAASEVEILDARQSAAAHKYPAVGAVLAIGIVVAWFGPTVQFSKVGPYSAALFGVLGIAVVADLVTTVMFFHMHGVTEELHPGVRLFGYAYGRTIGPLLAKLVQFVGVLAIALFVGPYGKWIIVAATLFYAGAAGYNFFVA